MPRRDSLKRAFIALLVLLFVTPPALLRPCCCSRQQEETTSTAAKVADTKLPPCCQKRLQAAQQARSFATTPNTSHSQLPEVHDFSRCQCRIQSDVAISHRTQFKALFSSQLDLATADASIGLTSAGSLHSTLLAPAYNSPPDWGAADLARLCRWQV